jgi:hypothetical protein
MIAILTGVRWNLKIVLVFVFHIFVSNLYFEKWLWLVMSEIEVKVKNIYDSFIASPQLCPVTGQRE